MARSSSRVTYREPIMGLRYAPYRETGTRDFGLYSVVGFLLPPLGLLAHISGMNTEVTWKGAGITIGAIFLIIVFISAISSNGSSGGTPNTTEATTPIAQACAGYSNPQIINYKQLDKDPASFQGQSTTFTGQVVQIQEQNGAGYIRLAVDKDSYGWNVGDIILVGYLGHNDAVADDVITVDGVMEGSQTYTSQANFQITVPFMLGCSITKGVVKSTTKSTSNTASAKTTASVVQPSTPLVQTPVFVSPTSARLGQRIQVLEGIYLTVSAPEDYTSSDTFFQPKTGNKFISVFVLLENNSQNQIEYNPGYFTAVDSTGGSYDNGYVNETPVLSYGELNPSNRVSGYVVFEVPASIAASQFTIHYWDHSYQGAVVDFK